jgi:hypothetical protein
MGTTPISVSYHDWQRICEAASTIAGVPQWARQALQSSSDALEVSVEMETVSSSYLDFLREQLALRARGMEWNRVLESRLCALQQYENQQVLLVSIHSPEGYFSLRVTPKDFVIVHWEAIASA